MKPVAVSLVALLVAVLALAVGLLQSPEPQVRASEPRSEVGADTAALVDRLAQAEAELARLREDVEFLRSSPPAAREVKRTDASADGAALAKRLAEVERQISEKRDDPTSKPAPFSGRKVGLRAEDPKRNPDEWVLMARAPAATEGERLNALRNLRGLRLADGRDARDEVVPEMIQLAENSQDARTRADVWRQLKGVRDRSLVAPLLRALQYDPDAKVREEAAETLADHLSEPGVRAALQFAAENDPSEDVREQAAATLAGRRR